MLDSTTVTCKAYAIVVTIRNQGERPTLNGMRRKTTEDDIIYIKNHYTTMSAQEIALERGMVKGTVVQIARRLGVKKSKEWIAQRARERALDPNHGGRRSHFQKGNVPATKGRPISEWMSPEGIANSAKTRFKKGQRPLSWRPIGSERVNVEGYVEIKVREGLHGWDPKHRVVWAKANGAIPSGYHVRFRDGNKQNCDINNLYLCSKADLLRENNLNNYPEDIKEVIRLRAAIKHRITTIKRKQKENGKG